MSKTQPSGIFIHAKRLLSQGFFKFEEIYFTHRKFDGSQSNLLNREVLHIGATVIVLPYDWRSDKVLLIEQVRAGALDFDDGPWMIECVAGILDQEEEPLSAAFRELREETGVHASRCEPIGSYAPNPAVTTELAAMFIADADLKHAGGVHGLASENEDIRTIVLDAEEAFAAVSTGKILCANAIIPLMWLQLNRQQVRQRWQKDASSHLV